MSRPSTFLAAADTKGAAPRYALNIVSPRISSTRKITTNKKTRKRATSADAAEMPVKPSTPATIDTSKKISAHFRIVIARSFSVGRSTRGLVKIADLTASEGTGSRNDKGPLRRRLTGIDYRPTFPGKPGCAGSSPGKPLGDAPGPMGPGVPAYRGFGLPRGGLGRAPGALPIAAPAPAPCANADVVAPIRDIASVT